MCVDCMNTERNPHDRQNDLQLFFLILFIEHVLHSVLISIHF